MRGTKTFTASLFLAAISSFAASPDYFPLQTGNSWVFRGAARWFNAAPQTIDVDGTEQLNNREYFRVRFLGRTLFLRPAGGGINVLNVTTNQESPWLVFDVPDGQTIRTEVEPCTGGERLESRTAKIKTPAGEWDNALQLNFQPSCADAGITTMYFVPGIGPVAYETTSIAGPVRWELIYTRAGSTALEAPQVSFTVALDAPSYKAGDVVDMLVRLTIRNTHADPILLTFPSGQKYDLQIWNDKGESVYFWSADKLFMQMLTSDRVGPGERTFAFTANVPNLRPGRYVAEAWLATSAREYVGMIGFVVTP